MGRKSPVPQATGQVQPAQLAPPWGTASSARVCHDERLHLSEHFHCNAIHLQRILKRPACTARAAMGHSFIRFIRKGLS
jgi:hypothetical protein